MILRWLSAGSAAVGVSEETLSMRKDEMRNTFTVASKAWLVVILLIGTAVAQRVVTTPLPAMTGPAYEFSTGYSYLAMPIAGAGQVHMNGVDASGSVSWNPRWGLMVDTNYLRASDVPGTSHHAYMLNAQCGPEFYPLVLRKTRFFVQALGGAALIDGAVPATGGIYHGWLMRPSLTFGGGVEQSISRRLAIRFNGDYLHTLFYDPSGAELPQNNLRVGLSLVIRKKKIAEMANAGW